MHEWIEDALLPNTDHINDSSYTNALTDTQLPGLDLTDFLLHTAGEAWAGSSTDVRIPLAEARLSTPLGGRPR